MVMSSTIAALITIASSSSTEIIIVKLSTVTSEDFISIPKLWNTEFPPSSITGFLITIYGKSSNTPSNINLEYGIVDFNEPSFSK